jgi:hypothetical protein
MQTEVVRSVTRANLQLAVSAIVSNKTAAGAEAVAELNCDISRKIVTRKPTLEDIDRAWWWTGKLTEPLKWHLFTLLGFDIGAGAGRDILGHPWDVQELTTLMVTNHGPGELEFAGECMSPEAVHFRHDPQGLVLPTEYDLVPLGGECQVRLVLFGRSALFDADLSSESSSSPSVSFPSSGG